MCPPECATCSNISSNCTSCNISLGSLYTVMNTSFSPAVPQGSCPAACPVGYYSSSNVCKKCDVSCTVCQQLNLCTNCTMTLAAQYYFVNYECKLTCGDRFYPDNSDPNFYFCRSCPSDCV
jgi:hypothetical protein